MVAETKHSESGRKKITAGNRAKRVQIAGVIVVVPAGGSIEVHLPPGCRPVILDRSPSAGDTGKNPSSGVCIAAGNSPSAD